VVVSSRQKRTAAARDNVLCARILAGQKCKVVEEARTLAGDRRREPNHVDPTAGGPPFVVVVGGSFWMKGGYIAAGLGIGLELWYWMRAEECCQ
jgi:hypothetical protein